MDNAGQRNESMTTALLYHPVFLEHDTGPDHPECPARLAHLMQHLKQSGLLDRLCSLEPRLATAAEIALIHTRPYIAAIEAQSASGDPFSEDADTPGSAATYQAACRAAGAVLTAADAIMSGKVSNAFCAVRPPGHHALPDQAMGFCFFNNVAIGARYLQTRWNLGRIAIVDWDVHHGNGTQAAFYDDPSVFFFSIHQHPFYPGSGRNSEGGTGRGRGFTLNCPVARGSTDTDYRRAFMEDLRPAIDKFQPEFILISAGFDAYIGDPLGGIQITASGFAELTRIVAELAHRHCAGRILSVLEGGYDLEGLATCVTGHLEALLAAP